LIYQYLSFYVARLIEITLNETFSATKTCNGFTDSRGIELGDFFHSASDFETATATAESCLNGNR
jgi:hypothetical protein